MSVMAEVKPDTDLPDLGPEKTSAWRMWPERWRWRVSLVLALLIALAAGLAWLNREQIAGDLIDDTLTQNGIEASYDIESIGTQRQVITNLIIGDPESPDLTADRASLDISYTYGPPEIGKIELEGVRLYASFKDGQFSLGSLDPLIFAESEQPAGLPALNLKLVDGRARIDSDYGVIGAKIEGEGRLDDGFRGRLAATAPGLGIDDCKAQGVTIFGDVSSSDGRLGFDGPVRLRSAECQGNRIGNADIGTSLTLARDFRSVEGDLALAGRGLTSSDYELENLAGTADIAWAFDGEFSLRHDLSAKQFSAPFGKAGRLGAKGTLSSRDDFGRNEWTARLTGGNIDLGALLQGTALADARTASSGTFVGALLDKFQKAVAGATTGNSLSGGISMRTEAGSVRVVIPEARLRSSSGETLIALSRLSYNTASEGQPQRLAGNILTGGPGLPRINARLQPAGKDAIALRMAMAEYREGENAISIPRLEARQDASGRLSFNGIAQTEGIIPGGILQGLKLPIEGTYSEGSGIAIGRRCLDAQIQGLETSGFTLAPQTLYTLSRQRQSALEV